nr:5-formyltetrahydrofolate cyclo-ligase [Lachnospiraceae bacterium]
MEKKEYRKSMKALRDGLSDEIGAVSKAVCEKIVSTDLYKAAKNVFVYAAIGSEISLDELVKKAYGDGKHVFYPVTKGKNMDFYEVFPGEGLKEGAFNVPEPDISEKEAASLIGALMLVPGVAFDESLSRMGYGAGFYDRYLEAHNDLVTMGVSSERLIRPFGEIPTEPHDKKLDYVVTEERLIKRRFDRDGFIDYINSKHRNPGVTGIEAASLLMEELSHPEKRLKFIHVTGTNGKGSCCSFLREILVLNGEKVG